MAYVPANRWWVEISTPKQGTVRVGPTNEARARSTFQIETEFVEQGYEIRLRGGDRDEGGLVYDAAAPPCEQCSARGYSSQECAEARERRSQMINAPGALEVGGAG